MSVWVSATNIALAGESLYYATGSRGDVVFDDDTINRLPLTAER